MGEAYGTEVGLPLLLSLALVATTSCALLWWGARWTRRDHQGAAAPSRYPSHAMLDSSWPVWVTLVTVLFLAANHLLVRGAAVGRWDADGQFFPYFVLVADHARAARVVQWDPWSNGGLPALGDPQVGAFSPIHVGLGLLTGGTSTGFRMYWLLSWWLGGLGMLMLGRHLGAPRWGAAAVALGFLFCGAYTGNAEHTSWIAAFSFLPLTIWRLDAALSSGSLRPAAEAGALWGLSALAGYPGIVIATGGFAALWALGRAVLPHHPLPEREPPLPDRGRALKTLGVVLLVGIVVLAPTYFAFFFEAAGTSPRVGPLSRDIALSNALEPGALATFASPYLAGLKVARQFPPPGMAPAPLWPATDPSMVSIYAGAIVPSLALLAALRRDWWRWWIVVLGGVSLACAMGETLPLRGWLYDWVYPTRFFRHSALFRLYFLFAVCVLALEATRDLAADLREEPGPRRSRFLGTSVLLGCAAALGAAPFFAAEASAGMPANAVLLGRLHLAWIWAGLGAIALGAWLLPSRWAGWCVPLLLTAMAASDALLTSVLSIPTVLRIGPPAERWRQLDRLHRATLDLTGSGLWRTASACEPNTASARCRRNDQLITKTPVLDSYAPEKNPFQLAMVRDSVLRDMATGAERIWFAEVAAEVPVTEAAFAAFRRRASALRAPPLVRHTRNDLLGRDSRGEGLGALEAIETLPPARRVRVSVRRYRPGELLFDVRAPTDGWLLVTDRWARSWRAEVNGRPTTLEGGNFIFRTLPVPAGANRVRLTYHPAGLPWLLIASWTTLALVAGRSLRRSDRSLLSAEPSGRPIH